MSRIVLRGIGKRFGAATILRGVDLQVGDGEFCVFVGPSGCGKSTLLRLVAGLDDPSEGEIEIDGAVVNALPPARRGIAMVFQSYALYPHMSAYENMAFGLRHQKIAAGEIDRRVQEATRILHLESLLARKPRDLSGGERQRVAIGRAIVRKPRLFLFDEPLSNLDAALRVATRAEIARLHRTLGSAAMIYVTHDQVEAMTLADRIVLLQPVAARPDLPSVAQAGAPLDLYHRPASRFVAGFIGSPGMNFLDGHVTRTGAGSIDVRLDGFECAAAVRGGGLASGAPITLGIRPEHVVFGDGAIEARATHVERLGEFSHVYLDLPGGQTLVAKTPRSDVAVGETSRVDLPPAQMHAFREDGSALERVQASL